MGGQQGYYSSPVTGVNGGGKPGGASSGGGIAQPSPGSKPGGQLPGGSTMPANPPNVGPVQLPHNPAFDQAGGAGSNALNPVPSWFQGGIGGGMFRGVDHPAHDIGRGFVPRAQLGGGPTTMRNMIQNQQATPPPQQTQPPVAS